MGVLVEHLLVSAELLVGNFGQIHTLGQIVTDSAVLTFADAALPGAMRVAKKTLSPRSAARVLCWNISFPWS